MTSIRLLQNADKVLVLLNGRLIADMPWQGALDVGKAFTQIGRLAEEYAKANQVIADGAILFRMGIPLGLTDNSRMQHEIVKEGIWNRILRRYLPGGVKSKVLFGRPRIIKNEEV